MTDSRRLWIELECGETGPCGVARDDSGGARRFSGWLELIALIQSPGADWNGAADRSSAGGVPPSMLPHNLEEGRSL